MKNEYLDILNEFGEHIDKTALKSEIHKKGYYHNTAHIWFYSSQGEILLQQRAATKKIHPLLWDVSVAGHVDTGETVEQAAIRETKEEIGLIISENDLQKVGIFECFQNYDNGIIDNEFHHTFISELKIDITKLESQKGEVEALKLISIYDFYEKLEQSNSNNHFISTNKSYYELVIEVILQKIT